jgi:lysozyme family protein
MGNNLALDGAVGPNTLNAINNANGRTLFNNFKNNRINFYNAIIRNDPSQEIFRAGWMNRINSINYH